MFASASNSGRNGLQRARLEPLNSCNQENSGHRSLLERLKSVEKEEPNAPTTLCQEKPRLIDVTAAFFGKPRRTAQESKGQMPPPPPPPRPPRPSEQQQRPRPRHQELRKQDKQRRVVINESPVAKELRDELAGSFATESSNLHKNGLTQLGALYEALKGAVADMEGGDDGFLAIVESNQRRLTKSPSETAIAESSSDEDGNTTRREVHIGREVAAVGELILTLEREVSHLWDAWETADRDVQAKLAALDGRAELSASKDDCGKDVQQSLAEDMKAFEAEAEGIIEDSHEEARACEKEFGRKIHGAMSALLQQYLLED